MNESNAASLAITFDKLVPALLKKVFLVNNSLNDLQVAMVIHSLGNSKGLKALGIIGNEVG